jgi:hypothetical protein
MLVRRVPEVMTVMTVTMASPENLVLLVPEAQVAAGMARMESMVVMD